MSDILRSFCIQLLAAARLEFDVVSIISTREQLLSLQGGDLRELQKLFEHLVFAAARSYSAVVCFIDGLHVLERVENGFRLFSEMFEVFERLAGRISTNRTFPFKLLLTLPEKSHKRWDQLNRGHIEIRELAAEESNN